MKCSPPPFHHNKYTQLIHIADSILIFSLVLHVCFGCSSYSASVWRGFSPSRIRMATVVLQNNWQSLLESDQRFELASPRFQFYESIKVALKPTFSDSSPAKSDDDAFLEEIAFNFDEDSSIDVDSKIEKEASESDNSGVDSASAKHPSSALSESSLRLCTESLGNESGSDFAAIGGFPSDDACPQRKSETQELVLHLEESRRAKEKCDAAFPPPLTTISGGSEPLRVSTHRLDGRLVIEAAKASPRSIGFRCRRSRGHLQLCY